MARIEWRDLERDFERLHVADRAKVIRAGLIARGERLAEEARTEATRRADLARGERRTWARRAASSRGRAHPDRRTDRSVRRRWNRASKPAPIARSATQRIPRPLVLVGLSVGLALLATLLTALIASPSVRARASGTRARLRDAIASRWGRRAARDRSGGDLESGGVPAPLDDLAPVVGIPIVGSGLDPSAATPSATEPPSDAGSTAAIGETLQVRPLPAEADRNGKPAPVA